MPKIKGFTTKGDVLQQIIDSGAEIKLPFKAKKGSENIIDVSINPFKGYEVKTFDNEKQIIEEI
jgi:hypothetical protein